MKYEVLTKKSILDITMGDFDNCDDYDDYLVKFTDSQFEILESLGYDVYQKCYKMKFNGHHVENNVIYDSICGLALKEGADLVRFENGHIGYVGYYGSVPTDCNCFEILGDYDPTLDEDDDEYYIVIPC